MGWKQHQMLTAKMDSLFRLQSLVPEDHSCAHFVPSTTKNPLQICQVCRTHISDLWSTGSSWSSLVIPPAECPSLAKRLATFWQQQRWDGVTERLSHEYNWNTPQLSEVMHKHDFKKWGLSIPSAIGQYWSSRRGGSIAYRYWCGRSRKREGEGS